jgi:hypothetical protein
MAETDPHVLRADHHPTPFTAADIRAGSNVGRTVRQRIEVEGEPTVLRIQQWESADDEGATRVSGTLQPDDSWTDVRRSRSSWLDLQRHASMPIATTTIDEVVLDSPMGPLECLRYTAVDGDAIETFWFARDYPGMPVMTERTENGRVVERVTMLSSQVEPLRDLPGKEPQDED